MSPNLSEGRAHGPTFYALPQARRKSNDGICIVCYVNMTVLDRMDFFCVHDMAIQFVCVGKHCSE